MKSRRNKGIAYFISILIFTFLTVLFAAIGITSLCGGLLVGGIIYLMLAAVTVGLFLYRLYCLSHGLTVFRGKHQKGWRIAAGVVCGVLAVAFVVSFAVTVFIYEENFGCRFETYEPLSLCVSDFDGLQVEECVFPSDKGQMLAGYTYSKSNKTPKGLLLIAHGFGGGGQNSYMDVANYFASNGYLVFAYDATGNDNSEGNAVGGLPQGVIDLDFALRYLAAAESTRDLPVVLFGHSWGGYSVASVLKLHPEVRAVVSAAGFNRSSDLIESQGRKIVGPAIRVMMPYLAFWEHLRFGSSADLSAMEGFSSSDAAIMVLHSEDDNVVPPCYGLELYREKFGAEDRFTFITYPDRGHNYLYDSDDARAYVDRFNEAFAAYFDHADHVDPDEKAKYLREHIDKTRLYELDEELFGRILAFYDAAVAGL